jgi:uncharacterized UBP type Zn finger protein
VVECFRGENEEEGVAVCLCKKVVCCEDDEVRLTTLLCAEEEVVDFLALVGVSRLATLSEALCLSELVKVPLE